MREHELPKSLGELHIAQDKINHALEKVDRVNQTIGTSAFPNRRFDLSNLQGEAFLDAAVRVGMVKESLEERAKPTLLFQKENVEREIGNFDRIQKAQEKVEKIRQFVEKGYLPESALKETERALADLTQGFTPPSKSAEEPHPVIVGRHGRNRIEARPSGVLAIVVGVGAEDAEGRSFILPNGQEVFNLTEHEKKILASLFNSSKDKPILSSDWARSVYGNEVAVKIAYNRISVSLPKIRRKLASVGCQIVNLSPKGKEGSYYLLQVEKKEEKPKVEKAREKKGRFVLPDGKVIENISPYECVLMGKLLGATKEKPVSSSEIARFLYGEKIDIKVGRDRLSVMMTGVRRKLEGAGWMVVAERRWEAGLRTGGEALYHLTRPETPLGKEVKKRRSVKVGETIELPDGKKLTNVSPKQKIVLDGLLCGSQEHPVSTTELISTLYSESKSKERDRIRVNSLVSIVKKKLDPIGWTVINPVPPGERLRGKEGLYYLSQKETEGTDEKKPTVARDKKVPERESSQELFEVKLQDGTVIKFKSRLQRQILEKLIQTSENNQIATDELAHIIFNKSDRKEISSIYPVVDRIQEKLESVNWRIVKVGGSRAERRRGEKMKYYLEKMVEEKAPVVEAVSPEAPKISEIPIPGPIDGQGISGVYTEIPYEPTEKEKRTEDETKILDVITSSLLASARMRFEEVQRQLYTPYRTKPIIGGEAIFIYQSQELIESFSSAFRKIREEAEIATLREKWEDKEKEIYRKLELLRTKFQVTEVRDFLRKISEEIRRSERQFYTDYPPESGNKVTWVIKDKK